MTTKKTANPKERKRSAAARVYAFRRADDGTAIYMHNVICGLQDAETGARIGDPDREVEHINGDTLDNRRANLRIVAGRRGK